MQTACGTYAIPAIAARFVQYYTNTVPIGPYRGAGRPDMAMLVERLVNRAAALAGVDPLDLRALNAIPRTEFPYRTPLGATYDSADYAALITAAREAAGWNGFPARRAESAARGMLRGRGVALFTEIAGGGASDRDEARVALTAQDGRVTARIETVTGGSGQSQAETYAFVLAAHLGLDPADIELVASPPRSQLVGAGSIASRSTISAGSAVADAGARLAKAVLSVAGLRANAAPEELRLTDGRIEREDGSLVMPLAEAVGLLGGMVTETGSAKLSMSFPSGCHIAEVEIDPETGRLQLLRYVAADDAGVVLNPVAADGQIHGGIVQGLGEVFGEAIRYDADGQVLTGSFMDYPMPRADDVPSFETIDRPVPSPHNPLGAKGLGEAGTTGALAAAANAVADALASAGAAMPDLPSTPERVWLALRGAAELG
jgi:carbon-monoxide dehydrogenase large subunit